METNEHEPLPSQFPSWPQVESTVHCGSECCANTLLHIPLSRFVRWCTQAWQIPSHALSQQTPVTPASPGPPEAPSTR
jgi:hypothetical protein